MWRHFCTRSSLKGEESKKICLGLRISKNSTIYIKILFEFSNSHSCDINCVEILSFSSSDKKFLSRQMNKKKNEKF